MVLILSRAKARVEGRAMPPPSAQAARDGVSTGTVLAAFFFPFALEPVQIPHLPEVEGEEGQCEAAQFNQAEIAFDHAIVMPSGWRAGSCRR